MSGPVAAPTVFDDGAGPALDAGGDFATAGGVATNRIAKWGRLAVRRVRSAFRVADKRAIQTSRAAPN